MLYKYKLGHNAKEATKNICCTKVEGSVDHSTVTRLFKKFCSDCKNVNNQTWSGRPKTIDSKAVLQTRVTNPASSTQRVSGIPH